MGRPEDPVLSYLDDTLARQVRVLRYLSMLSAFIDDEEALELAIEIQNTALEQQLETLLWRDSRKAWTVPELAGEFCAHVNGAE